MDREAVLERARQAGVRCVLVPATDLASSRRAVALAEQHAELRAAVGVHPNEAADFSPNSIIPGATAFTAISGASALAMTLVNMCSAAFDEQ